MVWRRWGRGSPLVLLHGGTGSWRHWAGNIAALAEHYQVYAADAPGLGDSDMMHTEPEITPESVSAIVADGVARLLPEGARLLVVNLDAHLDLREAARANSGTPFLQILRHAEAHGRRVRYHASGVSRFANTRALFERARAAGASCTLDEQLQRAAHVDAEADRLSRLARAHDAVYLTVCLDVLPAGVAPGVSAPAALGVPLAYVEMLVERLLATGRVVAGDVAEYAPRHDVDGRTARVGARLAARLATGVRRGLLG
jgi:formiminoglutamase